MLVLAIGMKVMVTFNIETDLDIANGARREIMQIVLDECESKYLASQSIIHLEYPPAYVLVKMLSTKIPHLEGLEDDVIPIMPME